MRDLSRLKVSFIAGTLGQGGAERQLFYILKALRQSGTDVRLLSLSRGEYWEQPIRELGVPITWVGGSESKFSRLCRIVSVMRDQPSDIFQSQHFYTNLYAVAAARVLRMHEVGAIRGDGKIGVRLNGPVFGRLSLRTPRLIAANSRAGIRNAMELGVPAARLHFLPNVVDCDQFRGDHRKEVDVVRIILVGRLVKEKRVDRFLTIVSRLRQHQRLEFKGMIVGDGPLRSQLEKQALEMGLSSEIVQFRGAVSDMSAVYKEADVLVLTSDYEGTPNVLLEAMAAGLPVVATKVGGVAEIVKHGETGYLVEPDDEEALLKFLQKMVADRSLRREFGARAHKHVLTSHSVRQLPAYLQELYTARLA